MVAQRRKNLAISMAVAALALTSACGDERTDREPETVDEGPRDLVADTAQRTEVSPHISRTDTPESDGWSYELIEGALPADVGEAEVGFTILAPEGTVFGDSEREFLALFDEDRETYDLAIVLSAVEGDAYDAAEPGDKVLSATQIERSSTTSRDIVLFAIDALETNSTARTLRCHLHIEADDDEREDVAIAAGKRACSSFSLLAE